MHSGDFGRYDGFCRVESPEQLYGQKKKRRAGVAHRLKGLCSLSLFSAFGFDKLAVETGDIAQRNVFGALGGAGTGVGAVAEAEFVHTANHGAGATFAFNLTLGEECKLAYLGRNEEHCRTIFAGCHAGAAADAGSGVHGDVGNVLRDRSCVGIGSAATVERYIAAGLLDFVECVAVNHEVTDNRECSRAPGLDGDGVAIVEFAHVELACGDALNGSVGMTVDVERAHAADTLAAVAVENNGLFVVLNELLVEHVKHFEERRACRNVVEVIVDELTLLFRTTLTPDFEIYAYCIFH